MLTLLTALALAQCSADNQCKGERICVKGECVGDTGPRTSLTPIGRAVQLGEEIGRRKVMLEEASIVSPSTMLGTGILMLALGIAGVVSFGQASGNGLSCGDVVCWYGQNFGIPSLIAGVVLSLVGGINLPINIMRRINLPGEIREREAEAMRLDAE